MIPAVSILVPVYNVSNYIERCAHSLFQQTFEDIEYVFVNDCTPDDSVEKLLRVIEQYPNRKEWIKIIHHEKNRGLAAARNTAIDNSSGKYIQHIDSDDWIELDMIEMMYNKAEAEQADIVVCDIILKKLRTEELFCDFVPQNQEDYFYHMLEDKACSGSLCNKLVHKKIQKLPGCRSVEGLNYLEDWHVTTRLYFYAEKIVKIDKPFYHYNKININSITALKIKKHYENTKLFYELLEDFLKAEELYEKLIEIVEYSKVSLKVSLFIQTHSYSLRKQYAWLFRDIEMKYISRLRLGEKLMLFFTHYRMYFLAHLTQKLIGLKNNFLA